MSRFTRFTVGLTTVAASGALIAGGLVAPASAAPNDPSALADGSNWLAAQVTGGVVHNSQFDFDDLTVSADIAFALDAVGGRPALVNQMGAAMLPRAEAEWYKPTYGGVTTTVAGGMAKAIALAQISGQDPTNIGGKDLVSDLGTLVSTEAADAGRIHNVNDSYGDANVVSQGWAVRALTSAGSPLAGSAQAALFRQQCSAGFFREAFKGGESCVAGAVGSEPSIDTTALNVINLLETTGLGQAASDVVDDAVTWLKSQQNADGSFGSGEVGPNANATGLAGWALMAAGEIAPAQKAAAWVRSMQVAKIAPCTSALDTQVGAIAYNAQALALGGTNGIDATAEDQWRRAAAQALPVLKVAPRAAAGSTLALSVPRFSKAGKSVTAKVSGVSPGASTCVAGPISKTLAATNVAGERALPVALPTGTSRRTISATTPSGSVKATTMALAPLRVPFTLKSKAVARGKLQVVNVRGLVAGETVTVKLRNKRVARAVVGKTGRARLVFKVKGAKGKAKVTVTGQFPGIRKATKTMQVR